MRVVPGFNRLQTRRYNPSHQKELLGVLKNITTGAQKHNNNDDDQDDAQSMRFT